MLSRIWLRLFRRRSNRQILVAVDRKLSVIMHPSNQKRTDE